METACWPRASISAYRPHRGEWEVEGGVGREQGGGVWVGGCQKRGGREEIMERGGDR